MEAGAAGPAGVDGAEEHARVRQILARESGESESENTKCLWSADAKRLSINSVFEMRSSDPVDPLTSALASSRELISGLQGSS